jgi:phosphate:Na+ symporter
MSGMFVFLQLAGAVSLLLWATRMVRTGVERGFGHTMRRHARYSMNSVVPAAFSGVILAIGLQSSTAVALLVSGFTGSGLITPSVGLAGILGSDFGSAIVARILTFDLSLLMPALLLVGTCVFFTIEARIWRQIGRILVGTGLLLLSLRLIAVASEPLKEGGASAAVLAYLQTDRTTAFVLAAGFTWLVHSSIATVLLIASVAASGLVGSELGFSLVLGANLGGALIATVLTRGRSAEARVPPVGNLILRGSIAVAALAASYWFAFPLAKLGATTASQIINAHLAFNGAVLLVGLAPAGFISAQILKLLKSIQPAGEPKALELAEGSALDPAAIGRPSLALACALREVLRMAETVEIMLRRIIELYEKADKAEIAQLRQLDDRLDTAHASIKLYLAKVTAGILTHDEALRFQELLSACIRLEQVGDIIVRNLLTHVEKKQSRHLEFSRQGWSEISDLHANVLANAQLAFNVLASRDSDTALQLVKEKERMRMLEKATSLHHFERLKEATPNSIETSSIHLDTIRDLKEINSLVTTIAYPILEEAGLLLDSRLGEKAS